MITFISLSLLLILGKNIFCAEPYIRGKVELGEKFSCREIRTVPKQNKESKRPSMGFLINTDIACEGSELYLACARDRIIKVTDAFFGRQDKDTCGKWFSVEFNDCVARDTVEIVKSSCENKNACTLLVENSIFTDPCPMVGKYLRVDYYCEPAFSKEVCEESTMSLYCEDTKVINIIVAEYGRTNKASCSSLTAITNVSKFIRCSYDGAYEIVRMKCQNKHFCEIKASNTEFGDPCPVIHKFLEVTYTCVEPVEEIQISPGAPKIVSVTKDSVTFSVDNLKRENAQLYKAEYRVSDICSGWLYPYKHSDLTQEVILEKLLPNKEYDIRIVLKNEIAAGCIPFTRVKTST